MKNRTLIVAALLVVLGSCFAEAALAFGHHGRRCGRRGCGRVVEVLPDVAPADV